MAYTSILVDLLVNITSPIIIRLYSSTKTRHPFPIRFNSFLFHFCFPKIRFTFPFSTYLIFKINHFSLYYISSTIFFLTVTDDNYWYNMLLVNQSYLFKIGWLNTQLIFYREQDLLFPKLGENKILLSSKINALSLMSFSVWKLKLDRWFLPHILRFKYPHFM